MKKIMLVSVIAAQALFSGTASADITRGCTGVWEVHAGSAMRQFGKFDARGSCRGRPWANDCRRAARAYAHNCFVSAWNSRNVAAINRGELLPPDCIGRGNIGVRNFPKGSLKRTLEISACSMQRQTPFTVTVVGRTVGDKRCGGQVVLSSTYRITDAMCGKQ